MDEQNNVYGRLFCVTDRHLCSGDFLQQMEYVASLHPAGVILREKDLSDEAYCELAKKVQTICNLQNVPFYVHGRVEVARKIGCKAIHLPYQAFVERCAQEMLVPLHSKLRAQTGMQTTEFPSRLSGSEETETCPSSNELSHFKNISVSCHRLEEAVTAERLGATQIILGTIYETACKPGKIGDGLQFLQEVCNACHVPVYGIGGVTPEKLPDLLAAGAAGGCMMSGYMKLCKN